MLKPLALVLVLLFVPLAPQESGGEAARWTRQAQSVTIVRDDWGIAHVSGKTDADTVFGLMYAQAEDDFNRVETNYLNSMGRLAEAEGESAIYQDLRMKMFIDPQQLQAQYRQSPPWLQALMNAYADGLNYYLATHPAVTPRAITHFEPWMALSYTEGSIGGDIEKINLGQLEAFYGKGPQTTSVPGDDPDYVEPTGSNGIAIAPSNTAGRHALLLINPHTSFFFRSEVQVKSDEGLNAYGAVTWGQFFVYQGFNERIGWMHTSSSVDNVDEFLETVTKKGDGFVYQRGAEQKPVTAATIAVPYRTPAGMATKTFTVYRTEHGPIVRAADGKWVSVALMLDPIKALTQSYSRTKARTYKAFRDIMELHTNSSNNTIYADADGNIAYFHSNYIPRRDAKFDWTKPVDGSDPATDYQGLLSIDETPALFNPASGWLYNSNNAPWSAAGPSSPKKADYPAYVDRGGENPRGVHAVRVLSDRKDFTLDSLLAAAFDSYLPAFAEQIPVLVRAWDATPDGDLMKAKVAEQIALLRAWDYRWAVSSVPTSLAVFYGEEIGRRGADPLVQAPARHLQALATASDRLAADFGTWKTPWGDVNRFQRFNDDIASRFDDAKPSIPVGFTSSRWGSLASFGARAYPNTKKWYGTSGNSFVAVVEFGDRVRARAVTAGGESGDPASRHFNDQAERYASGNFREVYFYPDQLKTHTERTYHPGQ